MQSSQKKQKLSRKAANENSGSTGANRENGEFFLSLLRSLLFNEEIIT